MPGWGILLVVAALTASHRAPKGALLEFLPTSAQHRSRSRLSLPESGTVTTFSMIQPVSTRNISPESKYRNNSSLRQIGLNYNRMAQVKPNILFGWVRLIQSDLQGTTREKRSHRYTDLLLTAVMYLSQKLTPNRSLLGIGRAIAKHFPRSSSNIITNT